MRFIEYSPCRRGVPTFLASGLKPYRARIRRLRSLCARWSNSWEKKSDSGSEGGGVFVAGGEKPSEDSGPSEGAASDGVHIGSRGESSRLRWGARPQALWLLRSMGSSVTLPPSSPPVPLPFLLLLCLFSLLDSIIIPFELMIELLGILSFFDAVIFSVRAYTPEPWLRYLGITHYPGKSVATFILFLAWHYVRQVTGNFIEVCALSGFCPAGWVMTLLNLVCDIFPDGWNLERSKLPRFLIIFVCQKPIVYFPLIVYSTSYRRSPEFYLNSLNVFKRKA